MTHENILRLQAYLSSLPCPVCGRTAAVHYLERDGLQLLSYGDHCEHPELRSLLEPLFQPELDEAERASRCGELYRPRR